VLYVYLLSLFFGTGLKPIVKNIGKGEDFRELTGICQTGTRSHMQMIVNLLSFDGYRVVLLKEWFFGKSGEGQKETYSFKVDGKGVKLSGFPYFAGMYTYSPTFIAIFKKNLKWDYISSDSCNNEFVLNYPGKGLYLLRLGANDHIKPCNVMSINTETVEFAPLFQTKNNYVFFLRVKDSTKDSVRVIIAREGKLQKSQFVKSGQLYLGIMDNVHYDLQIGNLDVNLPEALELLGQ